MDLFGLLPSSVQELARSLPLIGSRVSDWEYRRFQAKLKLEEPALSETSSEKSEMMISASRPSAPVAATLFGADTSSLSDSRPSSPPALTRSVISEGSISDACVEYQFPVTAKEAEKLSMIEVILGNIQSPTCSRKNEAIAALCRAVKIIPLGQVIRYADNSKAFERFCQTNSELQDYWWSKILKYPNDLSEKQKERINPFDYLRKDSKTLETCYFGEYRIFGKNGVSVLFYEKVYCKGQVIVPTVEMAILSVYAKKIEATKKRKEQSYAEKIAVLSGFKKVMRKQHKDILALQADHYQNNELLKPMADRALESSESNLLLGAIFMGITFDHIGNAYLAQRKFLPDQRGTVSYIEDYQYLTKLAEACFKISLSEFYTLKNLYKLGIEYGGQLEFFMPLSKELTNNPTWNELEKYVKDFYRLSVDEEQEAKMIGEASAQKFHDAITASSKNPTKLLTK